MENAEKNFADESFLKEKIYVELSNLENKKKTKVSAKKIRFVLATPEGDYHEIGLLLAHLLIRSHGYTSLFQGAHTPAQDLSETALRYEATHLLIVSTLTKKNGARHDLLHFVSEVQKRMGPELKILIAGSQAPTISSHNNSKLLSVGSFQELDQHLKVIGGKK